MAGCSSFISTDSGDENEIHEPKNQIEEFETGLQKLYEGFSLSDPPEGVGHKLDNIDIGASQYLRKFWEFQELPTDEALNAWMDPDQPSMSKATWESSNIFIWILYLRLDFQIRQCHDFLKKAENADLDSVEDLQRLNEIKAEARFLRALTYWHFLDFFGNGVPFYSDDDDLGEPNDSMPPVNGFGGTEIFDFIEKELQEVLSEESDVQLRPANATLVGKANKAAAYMLLVKLYMNAEVYTNQSRWNDAKIALNQIMSTGYELERSYEHNFLADNHLSKEIIFSIPYEGESTSTYGGMTYILHASFGGDMESSYYGISGGWGGNRATVQLVEKFEDHLQAQIDPRGVFYRGHNRENTSLFDFKDGYGVSKFKNITSLGYSGSDSKMVYPDTDFPMFRLADVYLMLAEIEARVDGKISDWSHLEELWSRASLPLEVQNDYKQEADIDALSFILDERARELYWEGHRRTDLIRFGKFVKDYSWPFKGGSSLGAPSIPYRYNVLPIPDNELMDNTNLKQNPLW
ncbi:RagB/SusD family nutrient uptake outer membrane protein [Aureibacter tunicatorum]|uniref:RagB/SusD domain-containing protein n=1 Tax=Aureibacter tunicatorum TaxID=866807 RepID=A0AAE3XML6_9BACT|nr:RagB/SusD family nutrient uptake outer membrane protein [Aureibacter tunicatorum]MDR6238709.1 hypothetical protein [Aureibacter tunicatorum]